MPVFRRGFQRFDPDLALVHGFVVGEGLVVALHTFQVVGVKRPMQLPTLVTGGTLRGSGISEKDTGDYEDPFHMKKRSVQWSLSSFTVSTVEARRG